MADRAPAVMVNTDVFSLVFVRHGSMDHRVPRWRELMTGRRVLICFQTRGELLAGALARGWGDCRRTELRAILDRTPTIPGDNQVVDAYATLLAECKRAGHALHNAQHAGDRWVAASAMAKGLDLLAGDGIVNAGRKLTLLC